MASLTVNRYRKARKIADVALGYAQLTDPDMLAVAQVRRDLLTLAGIPEASRETWSLVAELVAEGLGARV
jgi:hypothetical protein